MEKQEKKIKYEKPELIDLASQLSVRRAGGAACNSPGGAASNCNSTGSVASGNCTNTGPTAGTGCAPGTSPT